MALQKINWLQIDTEYVPSGSEINLGSTGTPINNIYVNNIYAETSSIGTIIYNTGSTKFGDNSDDTHQFTGSVSITGSLTVIGPVNFSGGTVSGTFIGDGSGLTNVSVGSISGLTLNSIASGSTTASVSDGAFSVNSDTYITGSLTVSESLYVSNITSNNNLNIITSGNSVNILGSNFNVPNGGISTGFDVVANGFVSASVFYGDGSNLKGVGELIKLFYVTEEGNDINDGKTISTAFRTIKQATIAASASIAANPGLPAHRVSIHVKTGYYTEIAPITVPSNTSILGDDLRTVVVRPTTGTKTENLFLMNNGTYVYGIRLEGCEIDSLENPRKGFFFAFAPNAYITTSPYVQNCTAAHTPSDKFYAPLQPDVNPPNPLVGNGPGGMIVDDSVLNGYSPLKSMIVDAYTQVGFNGIGICVRGRGYAQLVSFFTNFSRVGVYALDGGHASLLNSNTTFGDYGLRASGSRVLIVPSITGVTATTDPVGSNLIKTNKNLIRNYMINRLILSGSYHESYSDTGSTIYQSTITDSGLLIDAVSDDLLVPSASRTSQFIQGLFKGQDVSSGFTYTLSPPTTGFTKGAITVFPLISNSSGSLAEDFILSYQFIKDYIVLDPDSTFSSISGSTKTKVGQLLDVAIDTIQRVVVDNAGEDLYQVFGSLVTSTSHDFSYAGAGVNFLALPPNQGGVGKTNVQLRVVEEDGGRVFHTSGDETGDFYSGTDFVIRQATGTIEGRTFYKAISSVITPINLALESI
jgi:hypothetical protein